MARIFSVERAKGPFPELGGQKQLLRGSRRNSASPKSNQKLGLHCKRMTDREEWQVRRRTALGRRKTKPCPKDHRPRKRRRKKTSAIEKPRVLSLKKKRGLFGKKTTRDGTSSPSKTEDEKVQIVTKKKKKTSSTL